MLQEGDAITQVYEMLDRYYTSIWSPGETLASENLWWIVVALRFVLLNKYG